VGCIDFLKIKCTRIPQNEKERKRERMGEKDAERERGGGEREKMGLLFIAWHI